MSETRRRCALSRAVHRTVLAAAVLAPAAVLPVDAALAVDPVVTSVQANSGPADGGNEVIVRGTNLDQAVSFVFGRWTAEVIARSPGAAVVLAPSYFAGARVDVQPLTVDGILPSSGGSGDDYTYSGTTRYKLTVTPAHGPSRGGNTVTISAPSGADLSDAATVKFGNLRAKIVSATATSVTVVAPGGRPGGGHVTVEGRDGHSDGFIWPAETVYTWDEPTGAPVITSLTPGTVRQEAGPVFVLKGENLEGADDLLLDGQSVGSAIDVIETEPGGPVALTYPHEGSVLGEHTIQATGPTGTSAAVKFTTLPDGPAAVIQSVSPTTFSQTVPTELVVRGTGLSTVKSLEWSQLTSWRDNKVRVVSDTELRVTTPVFARSGPVRLQVKATGAPLSAVSQQLQITAPAAVSVAPASGTIYGGNRVVITADQDVIEATGSVLFDGLPSENVNMTANTITVIAPPHAAGSGQLTLMPSNGEETDRLNATTDRYTWTAAPSAFSARYTVSAVAAVPTVARSVVTAPGTLDVDYDRAAGTLAARLALEPVSTRFIAGGFLPVIGRLAFVPSGTVAGTAEPGLATLAVRFRVKLVDAKLFGAVPVELGNSCQSKRLVTADLSLWNGFDPAVGGRSNTAPIDVSDLNGCLATEGIISSQTAGGGTFRLTLTRAAAQ